MKIDRAELNLQLAEAAEKKAIERAKDAEDALFPWQLTAGISGALALVFGVIAFLK